MRPLADADAKKREALAQRLFNAGLQSLELVSVYLGNKLGFYAALETHGPLDSRALAKRTNTAERYCREWLEQQAVAGILEVATPSNDRERRTFRLSPGHAEVLLDEESLFFLAFMPRYGVAVPSKAAALLKAYRTGAGLGWGDFGPDAYEAQGQQNRPFFTHRFAPEYLAKIPEVDARLRRPGAKVADVACGEGWSAIAIAKFYPGVRVDGFDLEPNSIKSAKNHAKEAGVGDRVAFMVKDAANLRTDGGYDLVTIVEALHDMTRPVDVLRSLRKLLAPGGSVLVVDEKAAETFEAPGSDLERFFFAASITACLPNALAEKNGAGTGTAIRPATVKAYAKEAGFGRVDVLPLDHESFRFYRLSA